MPPSPFWSLSAMNWLSRVGSAVQRWWVRNSLGTALPVLCFLGCFGYAMLFATSFRRHLQAGDLLQLPLYGLLITGSLGFYLLALVALCLPKVGWLSALGLLLGVASFVLSVVRLPGLSDVPAAVFVALIAFLILPLVVMLQLAIQLRNARKRL